MANVAEGKIDESQRQRQQATLACTQIVNMHETHHCILPMSLSWSMPKLQIPRIWKLARNNCFLKMIFFSFRESLNSKKYTHIIISKNAKMKKKQKKTDD